MIPVDKVDGEVARKINMVLERPVRCGFPGCDTRFVPRGAAAGAYLKKGFCFCRVHQQLARTIYGKA